MQAIDLLALAIVYIQLSSDRSLLAMLALMVVMAWIDVQVNAHFNTMMQEALLNGRPRRVFALFESMMHMRNLSA